jgi:anti-sigma B factor antagonist
MPGVPGAGWEFPMDHHPDSHVSGRSVEPGVLRVEVVGEFDLALRPAFERIVAGAGGDVVVDLGAVTFLDSAGITAVVQARKAAVERGAELRIGGASSTVVRMFQITGLLEYLGLEPLGPPEGDGIEGTTGPPPGL